MIVLTKSRVQTRKENDQFLEASQEQRLAAGDDALPPEEQIDRVQYYESRPLEWMAMYLHEDFSSEFADHHPDMVRYLDIRGRLAIVLIFRNAGKGTILKGYTAHAICYGKEPYLTRVEHDRGAASNELLDLTREFKTNGRIIADYGHMTGDLYGLPWRPGGGEVFFQAPSLPGVHRENEFVYVRYVGLRNLIRGTVTLNRKRIGRIIVNDPVKGYEEAHSHAHTLKTIHTIKADAGFSGGAYKEKPISVTVVGTCQAKGDVMDRLQDEPMARVLSLPGVEGDPKLVHELMDVVNEDIPNIRDFVDRIEQDEHRSTNPDDHWEYVRLHTDKYGPYLEQLKSTWEARISLPDHIFTAANWGIDYFFQEIQHESTDVALQKFHASWFMPYDGHVPDEYTEPPRVRISDHPNLYLMTIDVAGEPREGSDPYAILSVTFHRTLKNLYVKHFWCEQATPRDLANQLWKIFWKSFPWYQGRDVTIYLEDTVQFSGIGRAYLNTYRKEQIQTVKDEWSDKIDMAIATGLQAKAPEQYAELVHQHDDAVTAAERYWIKLPIKLLAPASMGNKLAGIAAIRPTAQQRRIWTNPNDSQQKLFVQQFEHHKGQHTHGNVPLEFKNEGPDCTRMAFHVLKKIHKIVPLFASRTSQVKTIREQITERKDTFAERLQLVQR